MNLLQRLICSVFILLTSVNGTVEVITLPNNFCHVRIVEQTGEIWANVCWYDETRCSKTYICDKQNGHTWSPSQPMLSPFRYKVDLINTDQSTGWVNIN